MNEYKSKYAQKLEDKMKDYLDKRKGSKEESGVSSNEPSDKASNETSGKTKKFKPSKIKESSDNMSKWFMGVIVVVLVASLTFNVMSWQSAKSTSNDLAKIDERLKSTEDGVYASYNEITGKAEDSQDETTREKLGDISVKVDSLQKSVDNQRKMIEKNNEKNDEKSTNEDE